MNNEILQKFIDHLNREIVLIKSTLDNVPIFSQYISLFPGFQNVNIKYFVGLSSIRYTPPFLLTDTTEISDVMHKEIDKLNVEIGTVLKKNQSTLITPNVGIDDEGHACLLISLINESIKEEEIKELTVNINKVAHQVSDSSEFVEGLGKIIEEGIKKARDFLKKENERIVQNKGMIRKIPFLGSVYNWWSPLNEDMKGGSFNISLNTVVESEKNILITPKDQQKEEKLN